MQAQHNQGMGNGPITRVEGFDHAGLKRAVQGDWIVTQGANRVFEFTILGDEVRVLDHRFAQPKTTQGTLVLRSSTSFGIESREGPIYFFGFAVVGDTTYMGHGGAIPFSGDEDFEITLGAWERLVRTDAGCVLVTTFGSGKTEKKVTCEFVETKEEDEAPVRTGFRYQAPDPFRPDRLKMVELKVVGDYLMDQELARSVASRRGDVPTANAIDGGSKAAGE